MGVAIHHLALIGLIAAFVWLAVARALGQVEAALGVSSLPTSPGDLSHAANTSTGVQHEILGIPFGGFAVILAVPIAAAASTLVDVVVRNRDPAEEDVPTVLFSASDSEL